MKKININKGVIGRVAKNCASVAVFGIAMVLPHLTEKNMATVKHYIGKANYSDAISAIMGSDMFGSYKKELVEIVKRNETNEYYGTIIEIINSDTFGSYKVDMIRKISER